MLAFALYKIATLSDEIDHLKSRNSNLTGDIQILREEIDPSYKDKLFIPLHGMIMEVDETAYRDFYKAKDRDEYLTWRTKYKDISYSQFDDDECCGEDMLADNSEDIA